LLVVGEGEQGGFMAGLPPEVAQRIIFVGSEFNQVERYYAAADVFMFPTVYEPFGLVILEALSSGLPSVFSACAGAAEWLQDGVDAVFLHNPLDGQEARMALASITSDPAFAARVSFNGRRAAETLSWSNVATGLLAASKSHKLTAVTRA
jgi:glycosyltransferase involved in cell wall biosynthesis